MDRRQALKKISAFSAGSLLLSNPAGAFATEIDRMPNVINYRALFKKELANNPGLIGFSSCEENFASKSICQ